MRKGSNFHHTINVTSDTKFDAHRNHSRHSLTDDFKPMILIRHLFNKAVVNALSLILLSLSLGSAQLAWSADVQPGEEGPSTFKAMGVIIPPPAPDRSAHEGEGPFDRLVIENVMLVNLSLIHI